MSLRQLRYFVGVVEAGNMTRAADELHVAQTALGMQIQRALSILKLVEETRREVRACEREESETIRLGITPALTNGVPKDRGARRLCAEGSHKVPRQSRYWFSHSR